jgi:SAM-dependent methyltransferase
LNLKRLSFELNYLLDRAPWDTEETPPEVIEWVERDNVVPGRALDLGCGTGTNTVYLAQNGWDAVGVDFSLMAIRQARRRAHREEAACQFYPADVTALDFLMRPFDLVLDVGCLHSLSIEERERYAAGIKRLTRPGGTYMLYAFIPREDDASARGITPQAVRRLFSPQLRIEKQVLGQDPNGPRSAWYWLSRGNWE